MNEIESALTQMSEHLRALHDELDVGILVADVQGERFLQANPAICRLLGYSQEEMLSRGVRDIHPPDRLPQVLEVFEAMSQCRLKSACDIPCLRKDGELVYANVTTVHITMQDRPCMLGLFHDVTEERRATAALRQSEATLRGLFENLPDFVVIVDGQGTIQFVNHGLPGVGPEMLIGTAGFSWMTPRHQPVSRDAQARAIAAGLVQTVVVEDVFGQWWSCRVVPLGGKTDPQRAMVICANVTQERLAAEAVKKEQRLLRQMLELQERERRLLAYEIHDGFAQQLTGALFRLQAFRETLARDPGRAWQDFDSSARMLARAIDETRRLISGLRPPILDELGIVEAVEYLVCERCLEGGLEIEFDHDLVCPRLPASLQNTVFRIVQELFGNACRHSRSRRVRVAVRECDGWIHLSVRDWGVGFNADDVPTQRFGLQGVRERVRLLEGRVTIDSAPSEGTEVSVELPLNGNEPTLAN